MALEQFTQIRFQRATLEMIHTINAIIREIQAEGYTITLRQLYYQLVARDLFPGDRKWSWTGQKWVRNPRGTKNAEPNYKWLIDVMTNARLCGLVDWDAIEDRTRSLRGVSHWGKPEDVVQSAADAFRIDKWARQPYRVEVWVEKDALVNVLEHACQPLDVDYFSCRGNTSASAIYGAYRRFVEYLEGGQQPVIIHLADHDPTGIDMTRDVIDRLETMVTQKTGEEVTVRRIALNMDQVRQYNPPPSPAKERDSRFQAYVEKFGQDCWELDALQPKQIDKLITDAVLEYRDEKLWKEDVAREERHRTDLAKAAEGWEGVATFVESPERFIALKEEPEDLTKLRIVPNANLPRDIAVLMPDSNPAEPVVISCAGYGAVLTAAQFRTLTQPTSIKTKSKKKPKPSK